MSQHATQNTSGPNRTSAGATALGAWALLFGICILMVGNGLQGSLLGLRAALEGFGGGLTGLVMACFFMGFLIGSRWTPRAVQRVGHIRVFAALAALASITILIHSLVVDPVTWGGMRFVTGLCYAGIFVVAESWLNERTSNEARGQILAIYMVTIFVGAGTGQLLLNVADPGRTDLFIIASALISLAVLPLLLSATPAPDVGIPKPVGLGRLYRVSPLGTVGTVAAGIANGTLFGMGAVYAQSAGLSIAAISLFMGMVVTGAAALQWPIGRLSDLIDRRVVITAVSFAAAVVTLVTDHLADTQDWRFFLATAAMGGLAMTLQPLSIAYTNDYLDADETVGASSGLVLLLGAGSIVGPLLVGPIIEVIGPRGFFFWLGAVYFILGLFALWRMTQRETPALDDQGSFTPVPAQSTPFAEAIAEEAVLDQQDPPPTS